MQKITKHPHYVYRYYLRAWASNEQIWCLREYKKLFRTNLMKIGQENLFYEFRECTDEEIAIGYHYATNCCETMMKVYEYINNELRRLNAKSVDENAELMDFVKQFEEKYFNCPVEEHLKNALLYLYSKDFSFLDDEINVMQFFYAIAEQYCRTKKMKEGIGSAILTLNNPNIRAHNTWILVRHSLASKIGLSLYAEKYQVCLLENKTGYFLTTDQPVINIYADYTSGIPEKFELYYPISPWLALLISKQDRYADRTIIQIDDKEVFQWNDLIAKISYNQLYALEDTMLVKYKQTEK